jgi:hypothetical protein
MRFADSSHHSERGRFCCRSRSIQRNSPSRRDFETGSGPWLPLAWLERRPRCTGTEANHTARKRHTQRHAHATHAPNLSGGGCAASLANRRRFCATAASVNSNWAPIGPRQTQSTKTQEALQVSKQHLYFFAVTARLGVGLGFAACPGDIACLFVDATGNFACRIPSGSIAF